MPDPVVSIVVPTFGRPAFLELALASVRLQTFPDWECIVVDDASGEEIGLPDDDRFRLVRRSHNGGPGAARNSGVEAARGRYVAFLDDDDLLTPVRLHAGLAAAGRDPDTVTVVGLLRFDEHGLESEPGRRAGRRPLRRLRSGFPQVGQVLVPRGRAPSFDESLRTAEDAEWWLRLSGDARLRSSALLGYLLRRHPETRVGVDGESIFRNRLRVYEMHEDYLRRHRRARSHAAGRIASSALLLGESRTSAIWAARSLRALPTTQAAKVLARAVVGFDRPKMSGREREGRR